MTDTKRKRTTKGEPSTTKPKGSPVVGRQAETLFGGSRGNTPGQTSEWRKATIKASELAAKVQLEFLEAYVKRIDELKGLDQGNEIIALVNANSLKLLNDAIDRAHGKASSSLDLTSSDGSASGPSVIRLIAATEEDNAD